MERISFNKDWKVWRDTNPFELVFRVPEDAQTVDLPYDAMFHEAQTKDSINKGATGFLDGGVYKYYKEFFVPEEYRGENIFLRFEGIYKGSSIFINQSLAGQNASGYTDFFVKANDYLKYGETNMLMVTARCGPAQTSRWYSGGGIYRNTWLYRGKKVYLEPSGLRLTTLELDGHGCGSGMSADSAAKAADGAHVTAGALVQIEAQLNNTDVSAVETSVVITVMDADGQTVAGGTYPVRIKGQDQVHFHKNIYLENIRPWSAGDPYLYTVRMELKCGESLMDDDVITTGVRKLSLDSCHGLRVNGKAVKLRGACIHHDQGILGAATYEDYEHRRVRRLKEAGFNAVRSAHNPASQALLNACDALGVYVMDELTDAWNKSKVLYDYSTDFEQSWENDVEAMVRADYNHPSVIMYSTGNEIFDIWTDKGFETSRMLGDKFRELDGTRYTTNGVNGAFAAGDGLPKIVYDITGKEVGRGDVNMFMMALENHMPDIAAHDVIGTILEKLETTVDILGYNYMTIRYLKDAQRYPDRLMVGTETYPKQIAENWAAITQCPAALGDFTWTGWDYMGEVAPVYPSLMNSAGDISLIGSRRPVSYYREIVFGLKKGPCIAVQNPKSYGIPRNFGPWCYTDCTFNYNYPGQEGKPVMIQVYGGGDSVELFVNGKSLGVQPCGPETAFETQYNTTYEPGELVAVAYENGIEIGRNVLKTTKQASAIRLATECGKGCHQTMTYQCTAQCEITKPADEGTLAFVDIELIDADGLLVPDAENEISIHVEGPAVLAAFGSDRARHQQGFEKPVTVAGNGAALAVLKITGESGTIKVRVTGEGLKAAEALITVL